MEKIILQGNGIEIQFNDLSEEMQEKLYLQSKETLEKEAAKSQYANIRRQVIKNEQTSIDTLDEIFVLETEIYGDITNIDLLWNHSSRFYKDDTKREKIAKSDDWKIRILAAKDEESSSTFLNEMLRNEFQGENNENVMDAILSNMNFSMEVETFEVFAKSKRAPNRMIAGSYMKDSRLLNKLLREETQGYNCYNVMDTILENERFEMEEETFLVLSEVDVSDYRVIAAKSKNISSKRLNEFLRKKVKNESVIEVIDEILANPNFQMEQETLETLAKSDYEENRTIAAKYENSPAEFLENMYLTETDEEVLEVIELNLLRKISKTSTKLNAIQKRKILNVLQTLRNSKVKKPISKYLKEILEIIG